jgi:hypothetical protein
MISFLVGLGKLPMVASKSLGIVLLLAGVSRAYAGSYTVDHSFTGGANGAFPNGIVIDAAGNQYGQTSSRLRKNSSPNRL